MKKNIKYYIYIDEEGIDSIYSQLNNETVNEKRVKKIKSTSGSLNIMGGAFKGEFTGITELEKQISLSPEQKINQIIKTVSKTKYYYTDLVKATKNSTSSKGIIIVNIYETFYSRLDYNSEKSVTAMIDSGYLNFEKGKKLLHYDSAVSVPYDSYNYKDDYYINDNYRVTLSMNLNNIKTSYVGKTSHLAVALTGGKGEIRLGVLGQLRVIDNLFFQIKPFAVWF